MNLDRAKEQIRKLLNLGQDDGATEAEAENALRFARRLMLKHNVSEDDLRELDVHEIEAEAEKVAYGTASGCTSGCKLTRWEAGLAQAVCDLVGTLRYYYLPRQVKRNAHGIIQRNAEGEALTAAEVVFYGPEEDARDALNLFGEWTLTIAALARMKFNGALRGPGRSYCEGFVAGLQEKLRKIRTEERKQIATPGVDVYEKRDALMLVNATSLMEQKRQKAAEWLKARGTKLRKGSSGRGGHHHGDAFGDGKRDGQSANFSHSRTKKIGS